MFILLKPATESERMTRAARGKIRVFVADDSAWLRKGEDRHAQSSWAERTLRLARLLVGSVDRRAGGHNAHVADRAAIWKEDARPDSAEEPGTARSGC